MKSISLSDHDGQVSLFFTDHYFLKIFELQYTYISKSEISFFKMILFYRNELNFVKIILFKHFKI